MIIRRLSRTVPYFTNIITTKKRFFSRHPFPNRLTHYLRRAELIDSIRLALRSNLADKNPLPTLLSTRLLDPFVATHAIRSAPSADSALSLFKTLNGFPHFSHTQNTIHALATVLAKFGRGMELKNLISDIKDGRYDRDVRVSCMNLMHWYTLCGDLDAVLSTWKEYRGGEKRVCTESYNLVMNLYVRTGRDVEAVMVFYRMIDEGAIPNARTYTVMMEHLVSSGKLDSAFEIFRILPLMRVKRTMKQYLLLVEEFMVVERFDEVKLLLSEMRVDGMFPSHAMCTALRRLQEAGLVQETDVFLREMFPDERIRSIVSCADSSDADGSENEDEDNNSFKTGDVEVDGNEVRLKPWLDPSALASSLNKWSPDVVSELEDAKFVWTTRLVCKVLRSFKYPETAWSFFCWVAYQPGFTHDVYSVQRMMVVLAKQGKIELVDQLITKIRSEGMRLPFSTIRLIIDFYGISKNADAALKIFREDRTLCGSLTKFNLMLLYSSLLRTLTKCKRDSDAIDVLEEMILCGICPDIQTFSGIMHHFASQGDIKTVQKLFTMVRQSGVEPDAYVFKVLIQAYCKCERAALAWRVFQDMRNSKLVPDAATKCLLVKSLWNEGKRNEAAIVEESCEEIGTALPLVLRGHLWSVSSADLSRVYNIYANSFSSTTG